jgi:hypothetical protein
MFPSPHGPGRALVALVTAPDGPAQLRAAIDLLADALASHLSYEERELVEPQARLGGTLEQRAAKGAHAAAGACLAIGPTEQPERGQGRRRVPVAAQRGEETIRAIEDCVVRLEDEQHSHAR